MDQDASRGRKCEDVSRETAIFELIENQSALSERRFLQDVLRETLIFEPQVKPVLAWRTGSAFSFLAPSWIHGFQSIFKDFLMEFYGFP